MNLATVVGAAVICLSAAGQQQSGTAVDAADVAFGYTDSTGSKLLILNEMDKGLPMSEARAKALVRAVCSEGREFPIRYLRYQKGTSASSGRQGSDNFVNDEGHVAEIVQGRATPDDTCLLVPEGYLQAFPLSRNEFSKADRDRRRDEYHRQLAEASIHKQVFDLTPFQSLNEFAKQAVGRIEREKGRTAKIYWPLYRHGTSQEIAVVEFDAMGDSLLGSLVLVEPTRLSYFDMPASLEKGRKDGGCWRVDDDCRLQYEDMGVPAVLGEPGRHLVFATFQGFEGQLIVLFQARDGQLGEVRRNYRYQAAR
jgi:hypothetical protein